MPASDKEREIEILNEFVTKMDRLDELDKFKNDVNFFEITGMVTREIKHSNFLAWTFDSNGSHKLGNNIIRKFILSAIEMNPEKFQKEDIITFSVLDYSDFIIKRESDNLDIFMVSATQKITITIENKINASEGEKQTLRYRELVNSKYPDYRNVFLFLTIDGYLPEDEDYWCAVDYSQIVDALEYALNRVENVKPEVEFIIKDYITMVRRKILMNDEVQALCYKIYKSNKEAFDLIYANLPNSVSYTREYILEKLNDNTIRNKYRIQSLDRFTNNTYIRFTTDSILRLFPDRQSSGGWQNSFTFMYEIHPQATGKLLLEGVLSDANDETIKRIFKLSQGGKFVDGKEKIKQWARTFRSTILEESLSDIFIEDIKEKLDTALFAALDKMQEYESEIIDKIEEEK